MKTPRESPKRTMIELETMSPRSGSKYDRGNPLYYDEDEFLYSIRSFPLEDLRLAPDGDCIIGHSMFSGRDMHAVTLIGKPTEMYYVPYKKALEIPTLIREQENRELQAEIKEILMN